MRNCKDWNEIWQSFLPIALQPKSGLDLLFFLRFLITHIQTHGRTPLDEWSARRRDLYLHRTTQHITQQTNIHALSGIWTRDPSNQAAADFDKACFYKFSMSSLIFMLYCYQFIWSWRRKQLLIQKKKCPRYRVLKNNTRLKWFQTLLLHI
jgi:hypothetical protein